MMYMFISFANKNVYLVFSEKATDPFVSSHTPFLLGGQPVHATSESN
jgi:hypothetical protein